MNVEETVKIMELEIVRTRIEQASVESLLIEKGLATSTEIIEVIRKGYLDSVAINGILPSEIPEMFR